MSDASMTVYTAADINEGDEIQGLLAEAGIASTLEPVAADFAGTALLLAAVRVGSTRLIDNVAVDFGAPS